MIQCEEKRLPLHIDLDTGTDDAIALLCILLSKQKVDLLSVSTVAGNVPLECTSMNTLRIMDALGECVPVAKGADKPLYRALECAVSHGENGLGDVTLPAATSAFSPLHAQDMIYESACKAKGELVYLGVGPQTNLALALQKYPDLKEKIKRVYFMGGSLIGGNMTQASEFNAYVDPEALHVVVNGGIPVTMIGLDVTLKTILPDWVLEELSEMKNPYAKIATNILRFCIRQNKALGYNETNIHDAVAFCAIVRPDLITTKAYYLDVETKGHITRGMTVADFLGYYPDRRLNVDCGVDIDEEGFWRWMVNLFKQKDELF